MRVERFSIFFGRPLWSFRRGGPYAIGWIPLGGYVKSPADAREQVDPETRRARIQRRRVAARGTILAGPA